MFSLLNCDHPSVWLYFDAVSRDIGIQKKIVIDECSGQHATKKKKYVQLNERVKETVQNYDTYSDKLKYLRCMGRLQGSRTRR